MGDEDLLLPEVLAYIRSFPPKRSDWPSDRYYPSYKIMHCFECCRETDHYLKGIWIDEIKIQRDKRKWPVMYECDLCKQQRFFKFMPDRHPKFIPVKCRFSGMATAYSEPREYPMYTCFIQTRNFAYSLLKRRNTDPLKSNRYRGVKTKAKSV